MLEELANAAYAVGRLDDAFAAIERAIAIYGELGDEEAVGRCTRVLSRFHWYAGDGDAARAKALEAVAILEPLGESVELARAYSGVSQLAMLAEDADAGARVGRAGARARDPARRRAARARTRSSTSAARRSSSTTATTATLLEAHAVADAAGDRHEAARALVNLGYTLMCWVRPEAALRYARAGARLRAGARGAHARVRTPRRCVAWLRLRAGEWDEAERVCAREIERGGTVVQLLAKTVLAELAVRRGDPDAAERLADVAAQADRTGEPQRIVPVARAGERVGADDRRADAGRAVRAAWSSESAARPRGRFATARRRPGRRVAGIDVEVDPPPRRRRTRRCCGATGGRRPTPSARSGWTLRPRADAVAARRRGVARRGDRDRARARRRAADAARRRAHARARAARPARAAGGDARQPGRPHRPPARGARAARRGAHERGDRRPARRLAAHRRAPRRRRADEARRLDPPRRRPARVGARATTR